MISKYGIYTIIVLISIQITTEDGNYNPNRQPRVMGDSIPLTSLSPKKSRLQKKIVLYHNYFRSKVDPPAANMLRMRYHHGAARAAQRWAESCKFLTHDTEGGRYIQNFGACGQNIFVATHKVPWLFAVKTWWLEKDLFTFGKRNDISIIGHYTQMVWAATHKVGCGVAECSVKSSNNPFRTTIWYNYVCNYCPIGNFPGRLGRPYKKGTPCSMCKKRCKRKLCNNACQVVDQYSNCRQLYKSLGGWLCDSLTPEGRDRRFNCLATCTCRRKIHN